ncbi:hypothetical protein Taro_020470 [Colocasia esculenta]|uniref:Pentatricopeptide repeat-containing protein n=1 Tax=Colocasia esculenta TaxID=4460 RepID=A0A843UWD1_COLES|nr:hypothetical protein [Colocasia esculenta]
MRDATARLAPQASPLNAAINGYIRDGRLADARKLFDVSDPRRRNAATWNFMMAGYVRAGQLPAAAALFEDMPASQRDAVSWNTILAGLRRAGDPEGALRHFLRMGRAGAQPTAPTMATVLAAAADAREPAVLVPPLHAVAVRSAKLSSNAFVATALVGGYAAARDPVGLRRAFEEMPVKNAVSWTVLVEGYMAMGRVAEARRAFDATSVKNAFVWTTMVNGHIRNGDMNEARRYFDKTPGKNVVSWTSVINGCVQTRRFADAFNLFVEMRRTSGVPPNEFTYSAVLGACAGSSSLLLGELTHACILKSGLPADVVLLTSLVEMYAKCGNVGAAFRIFDSMEDGDNNLVSWNSIIGCCARHGLFSRALEEFERMKAAGVAPDHVTFVCVLTACAYSGMAEEGERRFGSMQAEFGIRPRAEHYACMVDLFGRAGQLEKAERLVGEMPFEPDAVVLGALAGACGLHSSLEHGLPAAELMGRLEGEHPAIYTMLMRAYGDRGVWSRVQELKRRMEASVGGRNQRGASRIESTRELF